MNHTYPILASEIAASSAGTMTVMKLESHHYHRGVLCCAA
jgi:hypothetical protein